MSAITTRRGHRRSTKRFGSDWLDDARECRLEARVLTAPVFYRQGTFAPLFALVWDPNPAPETPMSSATGDPMAIASVSYTTNHASVGLTFTDTAVVTNRIIDSGQSYPGTGTFGVQVLVSHTHQGSSTGYAGTDEDPWPVYNSAAASNVNGTPMVWEIRDADTGLLQARTVRVTFGATFAAANPNNFSTPGLNLASNLIGVQIGAGGITVTDNLGDVVYSDPTFGSGLIGDADVSFEVPETTFVTLAYGSQFGVASHGWAPGTDWYQDVFDWNISFNIL